MVTRREWYERVNAEWAGWPNPELPPLTLVEARRAVKKLYRFATGHKWRGAEIQATSGRRNNRIWGRHPVINLERGWQQLVHHVSHYVERGPHGGKHARMEIRLIKEVKRRGWLEGALRDKPKNDPEIQGLPTMKILTKLNHAESMMMRAGTRAKRAQTILKKWQRKVRYYERQAGQRTVQP